MPKTSGERMTGGDAIVESLIAQGVETVFAIPGIQNDGLFNALYDARDRIRVIHARHEQGVAYMALGYAMSTGKPGVFAVVPGPGFLNASAALATAFSNNAPVLCLVGQIPSHMIGRGYGYLHEIPDQLAMIRGLTKWSARINAPAEAPRLVAEAFYQMASGRPRPAGLEFAMDMLTTEAAVDLTTPTLEVRHPPVDESAVAEAAQLLADAKNPLIWVGSGAIEASNSVAELAELLQAPVLSSRSGRGVLSAENPLSQRLVVGHRLWERADVVLGIGTRMQRPLMGWGTSGLKMIRVDVDAEELTRIAAPDISIVARSEDAVPELVSALRVQELQRNPRGQELTDLREEVEESTAYLEPQLSYMRVVREEMRPDDIFVSDMTQLGYVMRFLMPVYRPRTFLDPGYQGTLGWSFATALGVQVANPQKRVLCVTGDGGFLFTMPELSVAVQFGINTVTVLFNDGAYGNVQRMQKNLYGGRVLGTELHNPDFQQLVESFGAQALRATSPAELREAVRKGFATAGPTVIEVPVGELPDPSPLYMLPKVR